MILEIRKLNAQKKYTGDFEFSYTAPQGLITLPTTQIEGDVKVYGSYEIFEDDSVDIHLKITYLLVGACSYCLNEAKKVVDYSDDLIFVTSDDGDNYVYNGLKIDLTAAVNDAILFAQPQILLCKEGCEGIKI